ncbi:hypothetical protein [Maribacter flavus]|uniref:Uncharacterized protein n=1 Tax=Maribacter flavus TaxID=1658664 RepID=A0A5B2TV88_9FLAO|nr:hypothetical protein [Maribacter flavus]KAA2218282.1 hypothetical protein F0361_01280 [Maribacter flavus]
MKQYTRFEVAAIFARCSTQEEVMKVAGIFGYYQSVCGELIPEYVRTWAHLRLRYVIKKNEDKGI